MTQFTDLGLAEPVLRALSAEGYATPTPIQAQVVPAMLAGRDVVGIAQTGTGKTAAFVLPLLHEAAARTDRPQPRCCGTLILAPTRELAAQIEEAVRTYGRFLRVSTAVVVGGVKPNPQIRAMARGVDILVATPGRLLDHVATGMIRLDATRTVILDEADQMLDLGFVPAIRRIMARLPKERRTALLSATMPAPIRALAEDFLDRPVEIAVTPAARPIEAIDQRVMHVAGADKRTVLVELMRDPRVERAIVFTRTKHGADKVQRHLEKAGLASAAIHGNKSQSQRERALDGFRAGRVAVLVATDIAARGIDVDDVSHVVNFELPNVPESYVHRIGRTARAGKAGIAVALCAPEEKKLLRDIERLIGRRLPASGHEAAIEPPATPDPGRRPARTNVDAPRNRARPQDARPKRPANRPGERSGDRPAGRPGDRAGRKRAHPPSRKDRTIAHIVSSA